MLFNSPEFLLFLPIVFGLYWFVVQRSLRAQNVLLVFELCVLREIGLAILTLPFHIKKFYHPWLDANTNNTFLDSSLFFDDHHLNHRGARAYTKWIKGQFHSN